MSSWKSPLPPGQKYLIIKLMFLHNFVLIWSGSPLQGPTASSPSVGFSGSGFFPLICHLSVWATRNKHVLQVFWMDMLTLRAADTLFVRAQCFQWEKCVLARPGDLFGPRRQKKSAVCRFLQPTENAALRWAESTVCIKTLTLHNLHKSSFYRDRDTNFLFKLELK